MAVKRVTHPSVEERTTRGKEARTQTPLGAHTGWKPATDRPDPVGLLEQQDATREFMALCAIHQHFGRPGTPTDQAWMESLFGHIKAEHPTC